MEKADIVIKRIDTFKFQENLPPMFVILDENHNRYHYQHGSKDVSPTLEYLILSKPGDALRVKYSVKEAFLDKDKLHKIFEAELIPE